MVAPRVRIGEILLLREAVDEQILKQTLKEQQYSQQRLVSVLINRSILDFDEGAMALSHQLSYPAALQRHLERRDPTVVGMIPAELARAHVLLPIGRAYDNGLVIVARDPSQQLTAELEKTLGNPVTLAVSPGGHLERLVRSIYGGPDPLEEPAVAAPVAEARPKQPEVKRARTISHVLSEGHVDAGTDPDDEIDLKLPEERLEAVLGEIDKALTVVAAERVAMMYVAERWAAGILFSIADGAAFGARGVGSKLGHVDAIVFPLSMASTIQVAFDTGAATSASPGSAIQAKLKQLLSDAATPAAAPIVVGKSSQAVLAVGDPLHGSLRDSLVDLARLVDALGAIRDRLGRFR
ncbi:MAG: hypothetical protein KF773_34690 [Deltaproteobacteria bacterium]|nr:hypothetical protein [Deltaproteobacteria bacterium]MCW5802997.1 hypothetical protein [Deltaproteobacteria bacterium]